MTDTERPDGWPEHYARFGESPSCNHYMMWDGDAYRCIHECGKVEKEPPEQYLGTDSDS